MVDWNNDKPVIAVITGGNASELEISLKSANVIYENLPKNKYNVFKVVLRADHQWEVFHKHQHVGHVDKDFFHLVIGEDRLSVDAAFVAIHGTPAEDGKLQGYLDLLRIPYTCSGVWTSAVTFSKDTTKQIIRSSGVKMANSGLVFEWESPEDCARKLQHLNPPVFVKPNKNGSSYGISRVEKKEQVHSAIQKAMEFDEEVLVEEEIKGRELTCAVMKYQGGLLALPMTEIRTENEFFDYEAKYLGKSEEITPAEISDELRDQCQEISKNLYLQLRCNGIARFDYILKGDEFYFLEVNTIPGFSGESIVPQMAEAHGWSLEQFFSNCIKETLS